MGRSREFQTVFDRCLGIHVKYWTTLVLFLQLIFILIEVAMQAIKLNELELEQEAKAAAALHTTTAPPVLNYVEANHETVLSVWAICTFLCWPIVMTKRRTLIWWAIFLQVLLALYLIGRVLGFIFIDADIVYLHKYMWLAANLFSILISYFSRLLSLYVFLTQ